MSVHALQNLREIVKIEIAKDQMQAFLLVQEPDDEKRPFLTPDVLCTLLKEEGITVGIDRHGLEEMILQKKWGERLVVAEGMAPIPGEETRFEFAFPTEQSLRPKTLEDGQLDYKDISVVHSVHQGDLLVKTFPATKGTAGMDVFGQEVDAPSGRERVLIPGKGTERDPQDPSLLRAVTDGVVVYHAQTCTVAVHEVFLVRGSLDYSTGNLHVTSSVKIMGDVKPGLTIETPYNIEVKGVVEHAKILCDGTLNVGAGITGDEQTVMRVGGDVHARYIYNQGLQTDGSVYVVTEIRNATIESQDEVVVTSPQGVIVGGHITATHKVSAATIGNVSYAHTIIEVGVNSKFVEEMLRKEEEKRVLEQHIHDMRQKVTMIMQASAQARDDARIRALKTEWEIHSQEIKRLEQEIQEMQVAYIPLGDPVICVRKKVYPNTLIKMKNAVYQVNQELPKGVFTLKGDAVKFCRV